MIEIADESGQGIDPEPYIRLAARVLTQMWLGDRVALEILFADEATMAELNREWMGEEGPTDVLSFPMDELRPGEEGSPTEDGVLGDVVVCPAVAAKQATQAGHSVEREMGLLVVHGILHLLGYDHATVVEEKEMSALQDELLDGFPDS
jgi:probable rRNA maturation factor